MSPFPQSVSNTCAISMVFFVPSPMSFVLRVRIRTKDNGFGFGDKVS